MSVFCIPKHLVTKLKESALKGEVDIVKLYEMSSAERRAFFTKFTDAELGKFINVEFEKAVVSKQQQAFTDWAKSVFDPKAKTGAVYKNILDKIKTLSDLGVLTPANEKAFLADLVADKLGATVTPEEVAIISTKATKIGEAQTALGEDLGNPKKYKENVDFFKAKKEMDDYLLSLTPSSRLKVLTGTIGRGMMLFSVKSPILNIGSNTEVGIVEALSRRLASGQWKGTDPELAKSFTKLTNQIFKETGYDISRMTSISDVGASGQRVLGETVTTQGPGKVRKIGRVVEDIVFKNLMGKPDVAFSAAHFADSANLNSLDMAKGDKVKAKAMMEDAMRITPQTVEGEIIREQAILDAQVATWTNDTWASKVSLGIRKVLNEVSGDIRAGDYLLPFIKTPANVIATGMDYAGLGIPKAIFKAVKAIKSGDMGDKQVRQSIMRDIVRSGLGITGALILAAQLDDDDFVGAYDPARAQIEALRDSNYNALRIGGKGGKWVSIDWLGPLSTAFSAIMMARKYGKTPQEQAFQYGKGVFSAVLGIPGVSDIYDTAKTNAYKKNQTLEEATGATADYLSSEIYSRLIPSFLSDIAKASDQYQRKSVKGLEGIQAKLPIVREYLPVKTNIFGDKVRSEPWLSTILFGARIKTDTETALINEISTVSSNTDKGITFTDWDKSSSKQLAQFKDKVGQAKYDKAKLEYGAELKKQLETKFKDNAYKKLSPEDKLKEINNVDSEAQKKIFSKYFFKYKQEKKSAVETKRNLGFKFPDFNIVKDAYAAENFGEMSKKLVWSEDTRGKFEKFLGVVQSFIPGKQGLENPIEGKTAEKLSANDKSSYWRSMKYLKETEPNWYFWNIGERTEQRILGGKIEDPKIVEQYGKITPFPNNSMVPTEDMIIEQKREAVKELPQPKEPVPVESEQPPAVKKRAVQPVAGTPPITNPDKEITLEDGTKATVYASPYDKELDANFGDKADEARRVLNNDGKFGENPSYNPGKGWVNPDGAAQDINYKQLKDKDGKKIDTWGKKEYIMYVSKTTGKPLGYGPKVAEQTDAVASEDLGLMRVNNGTYYDFMRRKPKQMAEIGITKLEDLYDPEKNIKVAKLNYDEGGWIRWYAAPEDLIKRKKK